MLSPGRGFRDHPGRQREPRVPIGNVGHRERSIYDSTAGLIRPVHPFLHAPVLRPLRVAVPHGLVPWRGWTASIGLLASYGPVIRRDLARVLGACGVLAYNWWILVPMRPGLMRSPNELFSNLEVVGHPFATLMERADLLSGLLMLAAFVTAGSRNVKSGRSDWVAMMIFSLAGVAGGLFHQACADGISKSCRQLEVGLRLPASEYVHIVAGVVEFGSITAAVAYAVYRTKRQQTLCARTYRGLAAAAVAAYPLLGLAYLTDRLGAIMEGLFFVGFSVMVVTEMLERTRSPRSLPAGRSGRRPGGLGSCRFH